MLGSEQQRCVILRLDEDRVLAWVSDLVTVSEPLNEP